MGFDGSGTYTRTNGTLSGSTLWQQRAAQANPVISATEHDAEMNDVATALTDCLKANGSKAATGNQPMGGFKHTGVADATANNQYVTYGQVTSTGVPDVFVDEPGTAATDTATVRLRCGGVGGSIGGLYAHNTASTTYGGEALALNTFSPRLVFGTGGVEKARIDAIGNFVFGTGGVEKARIDASGSLGIGTNAPLGAIDAIRSSATPDSWYRFAGDCRSAPPWTSTNAQGLMIGNNITVGTANVSLAWGTGLVGTAALTFDTWDGTTYTERARFTSAGRLGIKQSSPIGQTHSRSTDATVPALFLESDVVGDVGNPCLTISKKDNNSTSSQVFCRFTINANAVGSGQIVAAGASAVAFGTYSDARLKENVVDLPDTLEQIKSLRPVEFDYKDGSGHQTGFIAQEIQEIWPDVVAPDQDGYLMISGLGKTEARLVKAIQSLAAKVESLEARIAALEAL